jgi:hypothetical protein
MNNPDFPQAKNRGRHRSDARNGTEKAEKKLFLLQSRVTH